MLTTARAVADVDPLVVTPDGAEDACRRRARISTQQAATCGARRRALTQNGRPARVSMPRDSDVDLGRIPGMWRRETVVNHCIAMHV